MMHSREEIDRTHRLSRPRKSAAHLFLLPVTFGIAGVVCSLLVFAAVRLAGELHHDARSFCTDTELTKTLIVLPMMFASFPLGLLGSNLVAWLIPPARRYFDREAKGRPRGDFGTAMRDLLRLAKFVSTALAAVGFGAAFFGD